MMKILKTLALVLLIGFSEFSGCKNIEPNISTDTIVMKYTEQYIKISSIEDETDNHDIAAMLQTITCDLINHPYKSWDDVIKKENQYISVVTTGVISRIYTLKASLNEIKIVDGFCNDIIRYFSLIESDYANLAGDFLSESSTRFIVNMDTYEYEKFQNNR